MRAVFDEIRTTLIDEDGSRSGAAPSFPMPAENWYGVDPYVRRLQEQGFEAADVRSVRERVLVPFAEATRRRLRRPATARRWVRWTVRLMPDQWLGGMDYVLASARKPA